MNQQSKTTYDLLPAFGIAAVLLGIALESSYVFLPRMPLRAELAHAFGFGGIVMYFAGVCFAGRAYRLGWQPVGGLCALWLFVVLPGYVAPDWLAHHGLKYFGGVGEALRSLLIVAAGVLVIIYGGLRGQEWWAKESGKRLSLHCWMLYGAVALICQIWSCWFELWRQPYVAVDAHSGPRGTIEWAQVIFDAIGIWGAFFFSRSLDPTNAKSIVSAIDRADQVK